MTGEGSAILPHHGRRAHLPVPTAIARCVWKAAYSDGSEIVVQMFRTYAEIVIASDPTIVDL